MIARVSSVAFPIRAGLPPKNFLTQSAFALGVRNWYPPATSTKRIPRFCVSNSLCSSLRVFSMMSLFVPSRTSLKRCTDCGPSATSKRLEKHAAVSPQCFQQECHLFPHGDLVQRDLMNGLLGQAVNDAFESAQELKYRYLTKAPRTNFFGRCRRADKDIPSEKVALLQLGGGFFIALVF